MAPEENKEFNNYKCFVIINVGDNYAYKSSSTLIEKDNKVLIAKRSTGDPNVYGKWEFPGGKVELNEDELHAIEREIFEEFELKIKAKDNYKDKIKERTNKITDEFVKIAKECYDMITR